MKEKNTPNNNGREIRPNPVPQPYINSKPYFEEITHSLINIINWQYANLQQIEVDDMLIVYRVKQPSDVTILGKVERKLYEDENQLPVKFIWSELSEKFYSRIKERICLDFWLSKSECSLVFAWREEFNWNDFHLPSIDDIRNLIQEVKNKVEASSQDLYEIDYPKNRSNTILFDNDYLEEWMQIIKIWETEYIYELVDDILEIKVKVYSYWPDGSVVGEYLSLEEIWDIWLDLAETIILSEWQNLEDIIIMYASAEGLIEEINGLSKNDDTNDHFFLEEWITMFDDKVFIKDFSNKYMKVYNFEWIDCVYRLVWTTLHFYWRVREKYDDNFIVVTFQRSNNPQFLESLASRVLKKEGLTKVDMTILIKAAGSPDFAYLGDKEHMWNALWEWLSTNKTTLD